MQYRKILHDATESCRRELVGLSGQHEDVLARLPQRLNNILAIIADSVCQLTLAEGICHSEIPEDWRFYFWPGYDSVLYGDQPRRFAIRDPRIKLYAGRRVCTVCVGGKGPCDKCIRPSLTAAAFRQTLTTHHGDIYRGAQFHPGGTHAWLSQVNPLLPDGSPLEALVVNVNGTVHNKHDSAGFLGVTLPTANWPRWGNTLSEVLNDPRRKYPTWPQAVDTNIRTSSEANGVREIWLALYNIWLAATFADETQRVQEGVHASIATLRELLTTLEDGDGPILQPLLHRAETLADITLLDRFRVRTDGYRFWYSLPVQGAFETSDLTATRADLGSAMLFTNYPLTLECVFVIRLWVRSIYLMIRSFEATSLAHAAGSDDVRLALSHEVKKIANALGSHWIQPASRLFEVTEGTRGDRTTLGIVSLHPDLLHASKDMAFVPAASMLHRLGRLLRFWSMSDQNDDLPFKLPESFDFRELLRRCWEVSSDISIVHCLRTREITNRQEFVRFRSDMERLQSCRSSFQPVLSEGSENPFFCNSSIDKPKHIWLGRLLVAVLNNCIQHGHPMRSVSVTLTTDENGAWHMLFENSRLPKPGELDVEVSRLYSLEADDAQRLVDALMAGRAGSEEVSKLSSSENTIKMCFKNLGGGKILEWPTTGVLDTARTALTLSSGEKHASRIRGK